MAIYRCNACSFVSEDAVNPVGTKLPCGRCGAACTVYGTVFYVEKLVERYFAARREIAALQQNEATDDAVTPPAATAPASGVTPAAAPTAAATAPARATAKPAPAMLASKAQLDDIANTDALATAAQHEPLQLWLASRQIQAVFDHQAVNTTGFFDDAARAIGERYDLFEELMNRVRFAYRKSFSWLNLELGQLSQKDAQAVNALCRQLHSHTFFARYTWQKQEKIVNLTLQQAPAVRQFFEGGWLEWYAFMELLAQVQARGTAFACARGVKVTFPNEDLHELDVVFLLNGLTPICIECKSGEFRRDIEKYLRLKRRLGVDRSHFIVCATDLSDEQAAGLNAMYELTFVNLNRLRTHLQLLV